MWKIINYEDVLKNQYIYEEIQNSYYNDLFQRINIYLMQEITFVSI